MRKKESLFPQHLVGRPALLESQDEVFASENEMRAAISALIHYLKKSSANPTSLKASDVLNFMLQEMRVEFSKEVSSLSIRAEYASNSYIVVAPLISGETDESRRDRERSILKDFLPTIAESQIRATVQLYRTLSHATRKRLIRQYGSRSSGAERERKK